MHVGAFGVLIVLGLRGAAVGIVQQEAQTKKRKFAFTNFRFHFWQNVKLTLVIRRKINAFDIFRNGYDLRRLAETVLPVLPAASVKPLLPTPAPAPLTTICKTAVPVQLAFAVAPVCVAVDPHRVGDVGQCRERLNGKRPGAGDCESNQIGTDTGVGIKNRLPQTVRTAVKVVNNDKSCAGRGDFPVKCLRRNAVRLDHQCRHESQPDKSGE